MLVETLLPKTLFKGTTVFVTGGGSGINLGLARNFASPLATYVTGTVLEMDGGSNLAGSAMFGEAIEAMRGGAA